MVASPFLGVDPFMIAQRWTAVRRWLVVALAEQIQSHFAEGSGLRCDTEYGTVTPGERRPAISILSDDGVMLAWIEVVPFCLKPKARNLFLGVDVMELDLSGPLPSVRVWRAGHGAYDHSTPLSFSEPLTLLTFPFEPFPITLDIGQALQRIYEVRELWRQIDYDRVEHLHLMPADALHALVIIAAWRERIWSA